MNYLFRVTNHEINRWFTEIKLNGELSKSSEIEISQISGLKKPKIIVGKSIDGIYNLSIFEKHVFKDNDLVMMIEFDEKGNFDMKLY